ncbi:MAG: YHS domain-containing protein [Gemmatimonadota bacterium]
MNGLLWLLGFGIIFYLMMRFGCGAHVSHGGGANHGHGGDRRDDVGRNGARDPVCGMNVAAGHGYAMAWNGQMVRFCSRACLDRFETAPEQFTIS